MLELKPSLSHTTQRELLISSSVLLSQTVRLWDFMLVCIMPSTETWLGWIELAGDITRQVSLIQMYTPILILKCIYILQWGPTGQRQSKKISAELGVSKSVQCDPSLFSDDTVGWWQEGHPACNKLGVGLLVTIWLELCTSYSYSNSCNKHRLTQVHVENGL